jgi:hypothetical protein
LATRRLIESGPPLVVGKRAPKLERLIVAALDEGRAAAPCLITGTGRPKRYALALPKQRIRFEPVAGAGACRAETTAQACRALAAPSVRVKLRRGGRR